MKRILRISSVYCRFGLGGEGESGGVYFHVDSVPFHLVRQCVDGATAFGNLLAIV